MSQEGGQKGMVIGIVVVTVLLFAGLAWLVVRAPLDAGSKEGAGSVEESVTFDDSADPAVGPTDAKVVVHLYGDFQCPACRLAESAVKYAMDKYKDRVRFVWKDFPLTQIHKNARAGADAARCAEAQGAFWEYHDLLYARQDAWAEQSDPKTALLGYAKELHLDETTFASCLASQAGDAKVAAGMSEGSRNQVDRTPTFFIGRRRYFTMSPSEWDAALTKALGSVTNTDVSSTVSP